MPLPHNTGNVKSVSVTHSSEIDDENTLAISVMRTCVFRLFKYQFQCRVQQCR